MLDYLQNSFNNAALSRREYSIFGRDIVFLKDQLPDNVSLENVIKKVEEILPPWVMAEVDVIYIGHFDIFDMRSFNSVYENGAIYITNDQDDDNDMVDDLVHEAAHAIEIPYGYKIYDNGKIETEFLHKRMKLFQLLKSQNYEINDARNLFLNVEYNQKFDDLLYKEIGYELLDNLLIGVFVRPYAATSINEYFSTGFVEYYMGDRVHLRETCPKLHDVLASLEDDQDEL
jgi:hypothetical protein